MDRREFMLGATLGVAAAPTVATAGESSALAAVISKHAAEKGFSGTILVGHRGATLSHKGFGLADRSFQAVCGPGTRYRIASITKMFTSVLVMQLHEQGRLDLDAPIRSYLTDYKGEGAARVTIRNLLNHTSGIENMDTVTSYEQAVREGMPAYQLPHTTNALLSGFASGRLVRAPGTAFDYNNADYIILGKIVEALSGTSYDEALRRQILTPLGLRDTGLLYQRDIMPDLAVTYYRNGDGPLINDLPVYPENWYAAGGMYSTATDLLGFTSALYAKRLLGPSALKTMLTPGLDDYGFGVWIADLKVSGRTHRFVQRPGSIMGANTLLLHFPEDALTIIILANTNQTDTDAFGFLIARTVLA